MMQFSSVIENAIVQIITDCTEVNWNVPPARGLIFRSYGSGFCTEFMIDGVLSKVIVTNAHCVHEASRINIKRRENSNLFKAVILATLYECDLAILLPMGDFWRDIKPLALNSVMPLKGVRVYAAGFPLGGNNISITEGIVSRIVMYDYSNHTKGICVQIDAPINRGNSGGPVLNSEGEVVGITVAKELESSNVSGMGYIIPLLLLKFMIQSINHGSFKHKHATRLASGQTDDDSVGPIYNSFVGTCTLPIEVQHLRNPRMHSIFLPNEAGSGQIWTGPDTGVLVLDPAVRGLKPHDVLVGINNCKVHNDGEIRLSELINDFADGVSDSLEVVSFRFLISLKLPNDNIKLYIVRDGKPLTVNVKLTAYKLKMPGLPNHLIYPTKPEWLFVMGMVFTPNSHMLIDQCTSRGITVRHLYNYGSDTMIMSTLYDTDFTEDFPPEFSALDAINGTKIASIEDMIKIIYPSLVRSKDTKQDKEIRNSKFLTFTFKNTNNIAILHRDDIESDNEKIMVNLGFTKLYHLCDISF